MTIGRSRREAPVRPSQHRYPISTSRLIKMLGIPPVLIMSPQQGLQKSRHVPVNFLF